MDELRISVEEVKRKIEHGDEILFVDSRSPASWAASSEKIRGAIRVPPDEVAQHVDAIPKGPTLVTYCT